MYSAPEIKLCKGIFYFICSGIWLWLHCY